MARSPWHDEYVKRPADYVFGRRPSDFALLVARLLPAGARVLELGCGEGRDCLYFAAQGYRVTGVEISDAGLAKGRRLAEERGLSVRWVQGDMADVPVEGAFELVYSCGAIHYVPRRARAEFFARLRRLSPPAGLQAHLVFTDRVIYREKGEHIDYFSPGEIRRIFRSWRVRQAGEGVIDCAQDGRPHQHSVEQAILEAPVGTGPR
jgi:tellurite methyltransferase